MHFAFISRHVPTQGQIDLASTQNITSSQLAAWTHLMWTLKRSMTWVSTTILIFSTAVPQ